MNQSGPEKIISAAPHESRPTEEKQLIQLLAALRQEGRERSILLLIIKSMLDNEEP